MSVVVMAYHEMGCLGLRVLLERGVNIAAVFTYEDDPGETRWFGSVAEQARKADLPVHMTENVNDSTWVEHIRALRPDVIFSFYYRHMLLRPIRKIPTYGCVNLHGSLLPKYRGRCPINWQLVCGEKESGVTLHYIEARADAGDIIGQERVTVGPDDTALDLYRKLLPPAELVLDEHLDGILHGTAPRIPQDDEEATVFGGRRPEDGRIDWNRSAADIHNLVRAVAPPWPGAFSDGPGGRIMVFRTRLCSRTGQVPSLKPGLVGERNGGLIVGTGAGLLELVEVAAPGGRPLRSGEIMAH